MRASIRPEAIVSFVDGKTYKTLKRHLSANGFDPGSYRKRFGLPPDYSMVAAYARRRSDLAKGIRSGTGRSGWDAAVGAKPGYRTAETGGAA